MVIILVIIAQNVVILIEYRIFPNNPPEGIIVHKGPG